jgi:probable phosphoglycerate mutase
MTRIVLARHGQTAWNAIGRLQGHTDIALDDTGRDQARSLARALAGSGIAAVVTSDLSRARETGTIVADVLRLGEPHTDPELRERRFGVFEGLTRDQCASRHPAAWRAWIATTEAPPGGESRDDAVTRMTRALERVATAAGPVLVITHGGVMRLWLMNLLGTTIPLVANGTTYTVDHDGARFTATR